jgi:hypothetical protein
MCVEECQEFFLKRELPVVGFLTGNVTTHRFYLGFATRELVIEKAGIGMGHEAPPRAYPPPLRGLEWLWRLTPGTD